MTAQDQDDAGAHDDHTADDHTVDAQRERLGFLTAVVRAQERRDDVVAVLAAATTDEEAQAAVVALLDLEQPVHALAVLDLQLRRLTEHSRQQSRLEHDQLVAALHHRGGQL